VTSQTPHCIECSLLSLSLRGSLHLSALLAGQSDRARNTCAVVASHAPDQVMDPPGKPWIWAREEIAPRHKRGPVTSSTHTIGHRHQHRHRDQTRHGLGANDEHHDAT
jgi:hypothetical protein